MLIVCLAFGLIHSTQPLWYPWLQNPLPHTPAAWLQENRQAQTLAQRDALIDRLFTKQDYNQVLGLLSPASQPGHCLLAARAYRLLGQLPQAAAMLRRCQVAAPLEPVQRLEQGWLALAQNDLVAATNDLEKAVDLEPGLQNQTLPIRLQVLAARDPQTLLMQQNALSPQWQAALSSLDATEQQQRQVEWLQLLQTAATKLGRFAQVRELQMQQYVSYPHHPASRLLIGRMGNLDVTSSLKRAEQCVRYHCWDIAETELAWLAQQPQSTAVACERSFLHATLLRRQHRYQEAQNQLDVAVNQCSEASPLIREKVDFLRIKLGTILEKVDALPGILQFVARYPRSVLADDVLFWAGDLFERDGRHAEAERYYQRIVYRLPQGDFCHEAKVRLARMAMQRGDLRLASWRWRRIVAGPGLPSQRAQAAYFLGCSYEQRHLATLAQAAFARVLQLAPNDFYAALVRRLQPSLAVASTASTSTPLVAPIVWCTQVGEQWPRWQRAVVWANAGLLQDARALLLTEHFDVPLAKPAQTSDANGIHGCGIIQQAFWYTQWLAALELGELGVRRHAQWFGQPEMNQNSLLLYGSYPLVYRALSQTAEAEFHLPSFLLQALMREESVFNPTVISWAHAYGLTQLLPSTATAVAKRLVWPQPLQWPESLLVPENNVRLGGSYLAELLGRLAGQPTLAVAAYNAGSDNVLKWWRRGPKTQNIADFIEAIGFDETRAYVKRVLTSWSIYQALYGGLQPMPPVLPIDVALPSPP